jgi:hypothetical protein
MGFAHGAEWFLLILVIVLLVVGRRRLDGLDGLDGASLANGLRRELGRMPVYSAETTSGNEAEFIRDRLPRRFPTLLLVGAVLVVGALVWWLTR